MYSFELKLQENRLDSASPFTQAIIFRNDYYVVKYEYTDYVRHKAEGTLDKSRIHITATPYNELCAPKLTGTGEGLLMIFSEVMVSSEDGIQDVKDSIAAAEYIIKMTDDIIEEYFTNK